MLTHLIAGMLDANTRVNAEQNTNFRINRESRTVAQVSHNKLFPMQMVLLNYVSPVCTMF